MNNSTCEELGECSLFTGLEKRLRIEGKGGACLVNHRVAFFPVNNLSITRHAPSRLNPLPLMIGLSEPTFSSLSNVTLPLGCNSTFSLCSRCHFLQLLLLLRYTRTASLVIFQPHLPQRGVHPSATLAKSMTTYKKVMQRSSSSSFRVC